MKLECPFFWVNFKVYPGTGGEEGLDLARSIERVQRETGVQFVLSPQLPDIRLVAEDTGLAIIAPVADAVEEGRGTGRVLIDTVRKAGADALSINHAESRDTYSDIAFKIRRCKEHGLDSMVSVHSIDMGRAIATLDPDYLVFEKPEDISTDRAITKTNPDRVRKFIEMVDEVNPRTNVFVGGGIGSPGDVEAGFDLGVNAVGAASAVVGADDPEEFLRDIASAFPD